jgi:outer membrane lipoprotein-sorting protein
MKRSDSRWRFAPGLLLSALVLALPALAATDSDLEKVLAKMDETAAKFRTAQAKFTWTTFNSVVNDVSGNQTGKIYFQRSGNETEMAANIDPPDAQQVVFSHGKIQSYKSRMGTLDVYDAGTHREEFETFIVIGFGSSGKDMLKSFDVSCAGEEKVDGTDTVKLDLVPKSDKIKQHFPRIILWINPQNGISVQQKLLQPNGDYRLAKYSDIKLGQKIPAKVFQLKTSGNTKVVTH